MDSKINYYNYKIKDFIVPVNLKGSLVVLNCDSEFQLTAAAVPHIKAPSSHKI